MMSTYNPYAFQSYEVKASTVNKSLSTMRKTVGAATENRVAAHNSPAHFQAAKSLAVYVSSKHLYKWLLCLMVIVLFVTSFYLIRTAAFSSANEQVLTGERTIVVSSGDTLWKIATEHYDHIKNKNYAVFLIKERNELTTDMIQPGDQLILPEQ